MTYFGEVLEKIVNVLSKPYVAVSSKLFDCKKVNNKLEKSGANK